MTPRAGACVDFSRRTFIVPFQTFKKIAHEKSAHGKQHRAFSVWIGRAGSFIAPFQTFVGAMDCTPEIGAGAGAGTGAADFERGACPSSYVSGPAK